MDILFIFDRRINKEGAIAGMLAGFSFTSFYIFGIKFYRMPAWMWGISPEGIGAVGTLLNFAIAAIVSRLTPPPPEEIQRLVADLRSPEFSPELQPEQES